jgi:hypothetical protein
MTRGPRRLVRAITATMVTALLIAVTATAAGASHVTPVEGPPLWGALTVVDRPGFEASEFFFEGTADSYHNVGPLTNEAPWVVAPDGDPQPFKTRIQVVKPVGRPFNGTVYVEWLHPQGDFSPNFSEEYAEIRREGAVYVGISASFSGVEFLKSFDPARYGSLVHPGDSYAYDIFSHGGQTLRDEAETIFGPGFEPQRFIATGHSATGSRLTTYVNAFGDSGPYDAYLPRGTAANPSQPLRLDPQGLITVPAPTLITNTEKPVMRLQSESENMVARQPDSDIFRWWEIAGSAHIDLYLLAGDDGESPQGAKRMFDFMIAPVNALPLQPPCNNGLNAGPAAWMHHAALRHIDAWVRDGTPPPIAPRMETTDGLPPTGDPNNDNLQRDEHGNAIGGIRSPHVDVPIATLRGRVPDAGPGSCSAFGATFPFSTEKLAQLYRNHGSFVSRWNQTVDTTVAAGFFTPEDGELVKASAAMSSIGKKK